MFNWKPNAMDMGGIDVHDLHAGRATGIAGMLAMEGPARWNVSFAVADCDATVAKAKELGGSVVNEPEDLAVGRYAVLSDPESAQFGVIKLAG